MDKLLFLMSPAIALTISSWALIITEKTPWVGLGWVLMVSTFLFYIVVLYTQIRNVPRVIKDNWSDEKKTEARMVRRLYNAMMPIDRVKFTFFPKFRKSYESYRNFKNL